MRLVATSLIALLLFACTPPPAVSARTNAAGEYPHGTTTSGNEVTATVFDRAPPPRSATTSQSPDLPSSPSPSHPPCMFDQAEGRYKQCNMLTTDGKCAAFGAWCGDAEMRTQGGAPPCMYDSSENRYKQCSMVTTDGKCAAFGAWCGDAEMRTRGGAPPCMFDPSDSKLKHCNMVTTDGKCAAFGAWCDSP